MARTTDLEALLMQRSLGDAGLLAAVGGQSLIDRGRAAVYRSSTRSPRRASRTNC